MPHNYTLKQTYEVVECILNKRFDAVRQHSKSEQLLGPIYQNCPACHTFWMKQNRYK